MSIGVAKESVEQGRVYVSGIRCIQASRRLKVKECLALQSRSLARSQETRWTALLVTDAEVIVDKAPGLTTLPDLKRFVEAAYGKIYPVHRLDRETSGVVVFARTPKAQKEWEDRFRARTLEKTYLAVCRARVGQKIPDQGRWTSFLALKRRTAPVLYGSVLRGGEKAVTDYCVVARSEDKVALLLQPRSGRTHQLRVHCTEHGWSVLGDPLYGSNTDRASRLFLHAWRLTWKEAGGKKTVEAPLPKEFPDWVRTTRAVRH